jgi:anti-anti-sigma factor
MEDLRVTRELKDGIILVECFGSIDSDTNYILGDVVKKIIDENHTKIIFDLSSTTYINSSGWSVFLAHLGTVRDRGGDIVMIKMADIVREVFYALELNEIIRSFDQLNRAVEFFRVAAAG